ncbi:MAG: malto-oligosyltrehalose trehalohydrolase, partial [Verrucomicrobiaceae bacterium]
MKYSVWAPDAKSMAVVTGGQNFPLSKKPRGWWESEIDAEEGRGYKFRPDGGDCFPDPRSKWQPEGVHGPSCVVDTGKLRRKERPVFRALPLHRAVIYEMHIGTFSPEGTYAGAARRLRHLADLGITHVEIMPVASFPGKHGWSYDGVHLYAPFPGYGTPRELADFVAACHAHGLAAVLDVVYNHLGPDGNYLPKFGPYFTTAVSTPWGQAVNFDGPWSDEVRAFVIENALMWLRDYGFDGL